jgi:hypothetical protein
MGPSHSYLEDRKGGFPRLSRLVDKIGILNPWKVSLNMVGYLKTYGNILCVFLINMKVKFQKNYDEIVSFGFFSSEREKKASHDGAKCWHMYRSFIATL